MRNSEHRYALVVFDWDGTIVDSAGAIVECIQRAAHEMGLRPPEESVARHVIGLGLYDALRLAVPELEPERHLEFASLYRRQFLAREDAMPLFAGMRELIAELRGSGRLLAVATGKSRRGLDRSLAKSALGPLFDLSRCADETHPKPHPAMLREILAELDLEPARALMIGDTSHDLEMARAASVDAVAVTYGAHEAGQLEALAPRACVASVSELRTWIAGNG